MSTPNPIQLSEYQNNYTVKDVFTEHVKPIYYFDKIHDFGSEFDLELNKVLESSSLSASHELIKIKHLDILMDNMREASKTWKNAVSYSLSIILIHQKTNLPGNNYEGLIRIFNSKAEEIEAMNQLFFDSLNKYCSLKSIDISLFKDHFFETLAINFELTRWNLNNVLINEKKKFDSISADSKSINDFLNQKIDLMIAAGLQFWTEVKQFIFLKQQ